MAKILTLNIGASKALLAEYTLGGKRSLTLTAYGSGELQAVDVNDPGSIAAALPSVLHQIMRETGIRPAPLIVSLGGQTVFPRFAKFPAIGDAAKLEQLVRYEIEQNVPFPIDEIVSDHQFLGTTADGEKAAIIVAAKLEAVRAVTDAVRGVGLKPLVVDVSPMAICNALKFAHPGLTGCSVILDIGSKTTNLIILEDEKIYNRSIPVAGNLITKDIAQTFGCSFEEAEQLKLERGYVSLGGVTEDEDEVSDRVSKVIRTVLTRLHAEISRSINFYRSQQGGSAPSRLFLTGGCARLPQLDQFFMESLQVEVAFLNPFGKVGFGPKVNRAALEGDAFSLTESVGLALRGTDAAWISINLMPPELVEEARALKRVPFLAVGGVAFLAALGCLWLAERHGEAVVQEKVERVNQLTSGKRLNEFKQRIAKEQQAVADERGTCEAFQRLLWERSAALQRVRAVRGSLVPGMWITEWTAIPAPKDNPEGREGVRVTVRGWRDAMGKVEKDWSAKHGGEATTASKIVEDALKKSAAFVPDSVKIVAQKEVKECLSEFSIQMDLASAPSAAPAGKAAGRKGKAGKGK